MKKTLVALAAAAAISPAAFAGDVSWGGDANVEGFMSRAEDNDSSVSDDRGYSSRIRLKGTFKTDGNISVNTRLILSDSYWEGDAHSGVKGVYQDSANDAVAVDYGYIQAPIAGWTFRFGRQIANWANCFLTCDDRRDRILAMKRFGSTTVILLNDKRAGGSVLNGVNATLSISDTNGDGMITGADDAEVADYSTANTSISNSEKGGTGEGDLYAAAAIGVIKGWQWGLLVGKWIGEESSAMHVHNSQYNLGFVYEGGYALDEVYAISPFVKGKVGSVALEGAINILGGGEEDYSLFVDTAISAYIKAGVEFEGINIEGQAIVVEGGGLIAGGFDTFSILINNDADNNASNTMVEQIGGLGEYNILGGALKHKFAADEWMLSARVSGKVGQIGWKAAVGYMATENDNTGFEEDYTITTLDGGVTYAVAKTTELYLNAAIGSKSDDLDSDNDRDYKAATVGINTTF